MWNTFGSYWIRLQASIFFVIPICMLPFVAEKIKLSNMKMYLIGTICILLYLVEGMVLYIKSPLTASSYNVMMLPTMLILFVIIKNVEINLRRGFYFRKMSTIMYMLHPIVIEIFLIFIKKEIMHSTVYFGVICAFTIFISFVLTKILCINSKFKAFNRII